jgi:hypothetical protein
MPYQELTTEGKKFITTVCEKGGSRMLSGKNSYEFPFSDPPYSTQPWTSNILHNSKKITNGTELANALIDWYNKYSKTNDVDANIVAAQGYVESGYITWNYAQYNSTASGLIQMLMPTIWSIFVEDLKTMPAVSDKNISKEDYLKITKDLKSPTLLTSYQVGGDDQETAKYNRPILHQNVIDNLEVMIKGQCNYMSWISNRCNDYASSTLFCYTLGPSYSKKTYSETIQECINLSKEGEYIKGINYVLKTFGVLGDKDNTYLTGKGMSKGYKPVGVYFGYDDRYFPTVNNVVNPRNLRLNEAWNPFNANVGESGQYITPPAANTLISKYVTYAEATKSPHKFANTPTEEQFKLMQGVAVNIYDKIVDKFNTLVLITSFFRNQQYNNILTNTQNSSSNHIKGFAIDIDTDGSDGVYSKLINGNKVTPSNSDIFYYVINNLEFDAIIWEVNNKAKNPCLNPGWNHIQFRAGNNRKMLSIIDNRTGKDVDVRFIPANNTKEAFNEALKKFEAAKYKMFCEK